MAIRLVLADDHPIVINGLERLFALERDCEVVATCTDGAAALEAVTRHRPDVLVLDLGMPVKDGLAVLRELKAANLPTRAVVLTASLDEDDLLEAVQLGARGFLVKGLAAELIVKCVRKVHAGEQWLERGLLVRAAEKVTRREAGVREAAKVLTPRELEIVRLIGLGLRNKGIAEALSISEGTVKIHLHHVYEKLELDGRVALMLYAQDKGLA
jgi:DNA-binding NarL/FixJ family response regulator